mgnify:FL=1|tara:strand:+ start:495 stop:917 length:423 start_codon:yes stop_codon:yes gene_type:complete
MKYFKKIQETLLYYDFQPLLFFWVFSDILNNQVLWTNLSYWESVGQPYTYWLYFSYLVVSISMMIFIHNIKWLSRFVSVYLTLYLFSTIRYLVNIFNVEGEPFDVTDFKNILITCFYAFMWSWILFKLKREILHKDLNNE